MPKRTRHHELEDESVNAFRSSIPPRWVYRDKDKDYGIDGEVEIFDKAGKATGNIFYIQFKATDERDQKNALKVRIEVDHLQYWSRLSNPTLIVRYTSRDKRLYWKWAHSKRRVSKPGQKTLTVAIDPQNQWKADTSARIESEVDNYQQMLSGRLSLPLNFKLELDDRVGNKVSYGELLLTFQKESNERPGLLNVFRDTEKEIQGRIIFSGDGTTVYVGGEVSSITYKPLDFQNFQKVDSTQIVSDVCVTVGVLLAYFGHYSQACSFFIPHYRNSRRLSENIPIPLEKT